MERKNTLLKHSIMKAETAKRASRWVTFIHRLITILLAVVTGTGIVKNEQTDRALDFTREAMQMGLEANAQKTTF